MSINASKWISAFFEKNKNDIENKYKKTNVCLNLNISELIKSGMIFKCKITNIVYDKNDNDRKYSILLKLCSLCSYIEYEDIIYNEQNCIELKHIEIFDIKGIIEKQNIFDKSLLHWNEEIDTNLQINKSPSFDKIKKIQNYEWCDDFLNKSEELISENNLSNALQLLDEAEKLDPLNSVVYLKKGEIYYKQNNYDLAKRELKNCLKVNSTCEEALLLLQNIVYNPPLSNTFTNSKNAKLLNKKRSLI